MPVGEPKELLTMNNKSYMMNIEVLCAKSKGTDARGDPSCRKQFSVDEEGFEMDGDCG